MPDHDSLQQALAAAGAAHHDFELRILDGKRDELWAGFYAAYVLGRLGDFVSSSTLSRWLEEAQAGDDWSQGAAAYVISKLAE